MDTAWTVRQTAQNSGSRLTELRAVRQLRAWTEDRDRINIYSYGDNWSSMQTSRGSGS